MYCDMYNLNEVIGKRIAALRKASGMTQEVLAEKLNCSIKHISHVERGVASLSLDLLIEASDILNCSLDYLVRGFSTGRKDSFLRTQDFRQQS